MVEVERPVTGADPVGPGARPVPAAPGTPRDPDRPEQGGRGVVCEPVDQAHHRRHAPGSRDSSTD